jgi:hypothetical protein
LIDVLDRVVEEINQAIAEGGRERVDGHWCLQLPGISLIFKRIF